MNAEDRDRLRRRETELLLRIDRMKRTMNETGELTTLARQAGLLKEAQEELRRVQEALAGEGPN